MFHKRSLLFSLAVLSLLILCSACSNINQEQVDEHLLSALEKYNSQKYKEAIPELKQVILLDSNKVQARILLGEVYQSLGDDASAEKELRIALHTDAGNTKVLLLYAESLLRQNKHREILNEIIPRQSMSPDETANVLTYHGLAYIQQNEKKSAEQAFTRALKIKPQFPQALIGLATLALIEKKAATSRQLLNQAIRHSKGATLSEAWRMLAEIEYLQGDVDSADRAFEKASEVSRYPSHLLLRQIQIAIESSKLEKAERLIGELEALDRTHPQITFARGMIAFKEKRFKDALKLFRDARVLMPQNVHVQFHLGVTLFYSGNTDEAEELLSQVVHQAPESRNARLFLSQSLMQFGDDYEALRALSPLQKDGLEDEGVLNLLGSLYLRQGELIKGRRLLEKSLTINPLATETQTLLGLSYIQEDQSRALELLENIAVKNPGSRQLQTLVTVVNLRMGNVQNARRFTERLSENVPDSILVQNLKGLVYVAENNTDKARVAYLKALEIDIHSRISRINLANLELKEGQVGEARNQFLEVLKNSPGDLYSLLALAKIENQQKNIKLAFEYAERAMHLHPRAIAPRRWLANQYLLEKKPDEALRLFTELREKSPDNKEVLHALAVIQLLKPDMGAALETVDHLTTTSPNYSSGHLLKAQVCAASEKFKCLSDSLKKALRLDPTDKQSKTMVLQLIKLANSPAIIDQELWRLIEIAPDLLFIRNLRAQNAIKMDRYDVAQKIYRDLKVREPGNWQWQARLVQSYIDNKELGSAERELKIWLENHPQELGAVFLLGEVFLLQERVIEAIALFEKLYSEYPDNIALLNNLSGLYMQSDLNKAMFYANKAVKLSPIAETLDNLGVLLLKSGKAREALSVLHKAFSARPESPSIRYHLAMSLTVNGKSSQAIALLEEVIQDTDVTSFQEYREAEYLLDALKKENLH